MLHTISPATLARCPTLNDAGNNVDLSRTQVRYRPMVQSAVLICPTKAMIHVYTLACCVKWCTNMARKLLGKEPGLPHTPYTAFLVLLFRLAMFGMLICSALRACNAMHSFNSQHSPAVFFSATALKMVFPAKIVNV